MLNKTAGLEFCVDNYIEISNFDNLINNKENKFSIAALIGCIEGSIKTNKEKSYCTLGGIFKIQCGKYMLLDICNLVNNNSEVYNYIVNYFDLWHNNDSEEFTYDELGKIDIRNNFYELLSLLWNEVNLATELNDKNAIKCYNILSNYLTILMNSKVY